MRKQRGILLICVCLFTRTFQNLHEGNKISWKGHGNHRRTSLPKRDTDGMESTTIHCCDSAVIVLAKCRTVSRWHHHNNPNTGMSYNNAYGYLYHHEKGQQAQISHVPEPLLDSCEGRWLSAISIPSSSARGTGGDNLLGRNRHATATTGTQLNGHRESMPASWANQVTIVQPITAESARNFLESRGAHAFVCTVKRRPMLTLLSCLWLSTSAV